MDSKFMKLRPSTVKYNLIKLNHIVFEVTDECNLECKYCGYGPLYYGYDSRLRKKLEVKTAKVLLKYLAKIWEENIDDSLIDRLTVGFYGGEPLLNMTFIEEIVAFCKQSDVTGKKFYFNMTTNAMLLDRYMDFLVSNEFNLLISLDGNEQNQAFRLDKAGNNSFKRVYNNVIKLRYKYPDYFKKYVNFNAVLHKKNSVHDVFNFFMDNFEKIPNIAPLNTSGIRPEKIQEFKESYLNIVEQSFLDAPDCEAIEQKMFKSPRIIALTSYFHKLSGNVFDDYNTLMFNKYEAKKIPTATCLPFFRKLFLSVNGKILPCERIKQEFSLGQVQEDIVEIDYQRIADIHNEYIFKFEKQCNVCANKFTCQQCVYRIDDLKSDHPICKTFRKEKELQEAVKKNLEFLAEHPRYYEKVMNEIIIV